MRRPVYFEKNIESFTAEFEDIILVQGKDGKSAYEIACEQGFVGTEEEWILSLKGERGADGTDGVTFIPEISDRKVLSWTNNGGLENPAPVDLNPHDEWIEDGDEESVPSDYTWTDD